MKTERRHELQENELAKWLGEQLQKVQPYSMMILGVGILMALAFFVSAYTSSRSAQTQQRAWAAYFDAMATSEPANFEEVAVAFAGTQAAGWSLQTAGDLLLNRGINQLFQDRAAAEEQLESAKKHYEAVLADYRDTTMLEQRAMLGLAKCLETQGKLDAAAENYQEIIQRWEDSEIAEIAQNRLDQIGSPATREWYAWFQQQEPPQSGLTQPGMMDQLPQLPDSPDLSMPRPGQMLGGEETSDDPLDLDFGTATDSNDVAPGPPVNPGTDDNEASELDLDLNLEPPAETDDGTNPTAPDVSEDLPSDLDPGANDDARASDSSNP